MCIRDRYYVDYQLCLRKRGNSGFIPYFVQIPYKHWRLSLIHISSAGGSGADMTLDGEVATKAATVEGVSVLVK